MSVILVDQDGVIADWGAGWDRLLDEFGPDAAAIPRHAQQTTFNVNAGRTPAERAIIRDVFNDRGFYADLAPIPGARTALRQMLKGGHDVRIVTSPWVSNPTCASDKINWVRHFYGDQWAQRVVITTDKTLVRGDFLIDDKPEVTGSQAPAWEHVLFDQPYNQDIPRKRIVDWTRWAEVLGV